MITSDRRSGSYLPDVGGISGGEHQAEAGAERGEERPGDGQAPAGGGGEKGEEV